MASCAHLDHKTAVQSPDFLASCTCFPNLSFPLPESPETLLLNLSNAHQIVEEHLHANFSVKREKEEKKMQKAWDRFNPIKKIKIQGKSVQAVLFLCDSHGPSKIFRGGQLLIIKTLSSSANNCCDSMKLSLPPAAISFYYFLIKGVCVYEEGTK